MTSPCSSHVEVSSPVCGSLMLYPASWSASTSMPSCSTSPVVGSRDMLLTYATWCAGLHVTEFGRQRVETLAHLPDRDTRQIRGDAGVPSASIAPSPGVVLKPLMSASWLHDED